jgi:hypothetical protein
VNAGNACSSLDVRGILTVQKLLAASLSCWLDFTTVVSHWQLVTFFAQVDEL